MPQRVAMHQVSETAPITSLSELSRSESGARVHVIRPKSEASPPSIFAVAVMVGALGLSIANSIPGGLSGGGGFLLGLAGALVVFSVPGFLVMLREQKLSS